jgi:hypothetical protein
MSTPTYYDEDRPVGNSINYPQSFVNQPISSEIYPPNVNFPFDNPDASLQNQYITTSQAPIPAYENHPPIDEKHASTTSKGDLLKAFTVEMTRSFDYTRRFDEMSHKTDDLELFRFVMFGNDL